MNRRAKQSENDIAIGIYLHVPFCASTCDFCAFYQEKPRRQDLDRYLAGIERELAQAQCTEPVRTVFWGGGTPGLLPAKDLERLGDLLRKYLNFSPDSGSVEWTVEMAPSTVKADKIDALKGMGVNRISMGVQSFNPHLLEQLGRLHNPKQIYTAYTTLRECAFENINLDLMFAIPGQDASMWEADLKEAISLEPEHISTYCLTFEEDTALWVKLSQGKIKRSIENEAQLYRDTWRWLESNGYAQYEVSNFARPGRACIHNLDTWKMQEWRGFGPSAASQYGGFRFENQANLDEWLAALESRDSTRLRDRSALSDELLVVDSLIFGLRMNAGVDLDAIRRRFPHIDLSVFNTCWENAESEGYLEKSGNHIRLNQEGLLVADAIGVEIMDAFES